MGSANTGLCLTVLCLAQVLLFNGCNAFGEYGGGYGGEYVGGYGSAAKQASSSYSAEVATSVATSSKQQISEASNLAYDGSAGAIGVGGGFASGASAMSRQQQETTTTTTTTVTTTKTVHTAVDYISTNFQNINSLSMDGHTEEEFGLVNSFCQQNNGEYMRTILNDAHAREYLATELGYSDFRGRAFDSYILSGGYKRERKTHKLACALKRCRKFMKGSHKSLLTKETLLSRIQLKFQRGFSNSNQWKSLDLFPRMRGFFNEDYGIVFQSILEYDDVCEFLAERLRFRGNYKSPAFKQYLLNNKFKCDHKTKLLTRALRDLPGHLNGRLMRDALNGGPSRRGGNYAVSHGSGPGHARSRVGGLGGVLGAIGGRGGRGGGGGCGRR